MMFRFLPCPSCCRECLACKDKQYPEELTVTIAGVVDDTWPGGCRDCHRVNGSWALPRNPAGCQGVDRDGVYQSSIEYHGEFPDVPMCVCGDGQATLELVLHIYWNYAGVRGRRRMELNVGNSRGCLSVAFALVEDDQSEPWDCQGLVGVPLNYQGAGAYCSSAGATCQVNA
jgi:hypothetical protein